MATKKPITWGKLEVVAGPRSGEKRKGVVKDIYESTWKEYLTSQDRAQYIDKFAKPDKKIAVLSVEVEGMAKAMDFQINMPSTDGMISDRSNLYKYKLAYGNYPTVGDKVELRYIVTGSGDDENRYWDLVL